MAEHEVTSGQKTAGLTDNSVEHPGRILSCLMREHGLTTSEIADQTGLSRALLSQILNENRRITAMSALLLARLFGISAEDLTNAQQRHDLHEARQKSAMIEKLNRIQPTERRKAS